jgi:tripartite-type tricarboxylate transporter receptor subunit TctC
MYLIKKLSLMVLLMFSLFIPGGLLAQEYPTKPVTLIIPFGPGGGHDLLFRAVTSVAADYLGQPILIKLMPGGGERLGPTLRQRRRPMATPCLQGGIRPVRHCRPSRGGEKARIKWRRYAG